MLIELLLLTFVLSANALKCVQEGSMSNIVYDHGIMVSSFSQSFEFGYATCSSNLNRCVNFKTMSIAEFLKLDSGKDNSGFAKTIQNQGEGKVSGRICMSQSDVDKIGAKQSDRCERTEADPAESCFCTTDECTGSAGAVATLLPILAVILWSITSM